LGRAIFSSDKEHIHHRLMSRLVMSHRQAVLVLYGICCLFALTALGIAHANSSQGAMLLVGIGLLAFVLIPKLGLLSARDLTNANGVRRRNIQLRSLVKQVNEEIATAQTIEQVWHSVRPLADALQASSLELLMERTGSSVQDAMRLETRRAGDAGT